MRMCHKCHDEESNSRRGSNNGHICVSAGFYIFLFFSLINPLAIIYRFFSTVEIFSGANTQFPSMSRDSRTQTCKIWTNTLRPEKQAGISESDGRVASYAFNVLACPSVRYGQLGPTSQKGINQ